ncbi:MAG: helix-turn-helix transcriptional regulator [Chloracidobacterium sp.]|nr:helix-turn-helix transcriptional regulator [Chloracidobacterium sp.]
MRMLGDGSYAIDDAVEIPGEGDTPFVFCTGWLLEVVEIESGEYAFIRDGQRIEPAGRRFGAYYPAFTFVRTYVKEFKGRVCGVGSLDPLPDLPSGPVIFETSFREKFRHARDAVSVLASAKDVRSIEACSNPSLLSKRAKRLIDENYLAFPSIGRVADRLKVSHSHLSRQFKRDFEMTPSEYLHHLRVADATFRLSTGQPIIDISHEVGYNDLSRFYKQFRKNTNTSPAVCREMLDR